MELQDESDSTCTGVLLLKTTLTYGTKTHGVQKVTMLEIFDKKVFLFLLQQFCFVLI